MPTCDTSGTECDTGIYEAEYCSDLCGTGVKSCYEACDAAPNTCDSGELCLPIFDPDYGTVLDGVCLEKGADCPFCSDADGEM